eukprot:Lankesteria_metandrocarpae@DN1053_c0_g1_i1.p1
MVDRNTPPPNDECVNRSGFAESWCPNPQFQNGYGRAFQNSCFVQPAVPIDSDCFTLQDESALPNVAAGAHCEIPCPTRMFLNSLSLPAETPPVNHQISISPPRCSVVGGKRRNRSISPSTLEKQCRAAVPRIPGSAPLRNHKKVKLLSLARRLSVPTSNSSSYCKFNPPSANSTISCHHNLDNYNENMTRGSAAFPVFNGTTGASFPQSSNDVHTAASSLTTAAVNWKSPPAAVFSLPLRCDESHQHHHGMHHHQLLGSQTGDIDDNTDGDCTASDEDMRKKLLLTYGQADAVAHGTTRQLKGVDCSGLLSSVVAPASYRCKRKRSAAGLDRLVVIRCKGCHIPLRGAFKFGDYVECKRCGGSGFAAVRRWSPSRDL